MKSNKKLANSAIFSGMTALAVAMAPALVAATAFSISAAQAQEKGSGGKGGEQGKKAGGSSSGKGGSSSGVPQGPKGSGSGQMGPSADSDAKGPQYKGGGEHGNTSSGTRPVWAKEGLPEVELGRLNVARAPSHVVERTLTEIYTTKLDTDGDGKLDDGVDLSLIDSPIANLGLYSEALAGKRKVDGTWTLLEAATFLGTAADKYIPVSTDTVTAMNLILGFGGTYDYSSFEYNRAAAHPGDLSTVFGGEQYTGTGLEAFAQAADDARAVIVYYHDL